MAVDVKRIAKEVEAASGFVKPFFEEVGLKTRAVYLDPRGKVQRAFAITRFPTTVLIDARGLEVGRIEGPVEWLAPEARALIRFFMEKPR